MNLRINNLIQAGVFLFAFVLFAACNKFLDTVPRDKVSSDVVFNNYEAVTGVLGGVYDHMTYAAEGFAIDAASLGIYNFVLSADWMGQDIIPKNSSTQWMADDYSFSSRTMEKSRPIFFWTYCYSHINVLNDLLANISKMKGTSQEKAQVEGEARGLRAFNYWLLVQWFQQTFLINPSAPGVPLYVEPTIQAKGRAALTDNYEAIISDLKWVIDNIPDAQRANSRYVVNKNMAKGLLARVYMEMGNYAAAKTLAHDLVATYPLMSAQEYKSGFCNVNVSECIWGLPTSTKNTSANYALATVWSHPRKNNRWSQRFVFLNDDFVNLFANGDVRKELITINPIPSDTVLYPLRKYVSFKIMDPDDAKLLPDILLMRSSEMLLIEAECAVRLKNDTEAQNLLYVLQSKRQPNVLKSTAVGAGLLNEVILERRKELYGEGFAIHDIKRFRKPLLRTGLHTIKGTDANGELYPADSKMFFLQIPEREIQTNNLEQNP